MSYVITEWGVMIAALLLQAHFSHNVTSTALYLSITLLVGRVIFSIRPIIDALATPLSFAGMILTYPTFIALLVELYTQPGVIRSIHRDMHTYLFHALSQAIELLTTASTWLG